MVSNIFSGTDIANQGLALQGFCMKPLLPSKFCGFQAGNIAHVDRSVFTEYWLYYLRLQKRVDKSFSLVLRQSQRKQGQSSFTTGIRRLYLAWPLHTASCLLCSPTNSAAFPSAPLWLQHRAEASHLLKKLHLGVGNNWLMLSSANLRTVTETSLPCMKDWVSINVRSEPKMARYSPTQE